LYAISKLVWGLEVSILIAIFEKKSFRYSHFYEFSKSRGAVNRAVKSLKIQGMILKDRKNNYRCTKRGKKTALMLKELRFILRSIKPTKLKNFN